MAAIRPPFFLRARKWDRGRVLSQIGAPGVRGMLAPRGTGVGYRPNWVAACVNGGTREQGMEVVFRTDARET